MAVGYAGDVLLDHLHRGTTTRDLRIVQDSGISNIGGSLAQHIKEIEDELSEFVLVLPADHVLEGLNVPELIQRHVIKKCK